MLKRILLMSLCVSFFGLGDACAQQKSLSWSINCINGSCDATAGGIKVSWSTPFTMGDYMIGNLTGISGLPIKVEEMQKAEQAVNNTIEKSVTKSIQSRASLKFDPDGGEQKATGKSTGYDLSQEQSMSKKRSFGESRAAGQSGGVDLTMALVKWVGDNANLGEKYADPHNIHRYLFAAEFILGEYFAGRSADLIEIYLVQSALTRNDGIDFAAAGEDNFLLTEVKRMALSGLTANSPDKYSRAAKWIYDISTVPSLSSYKKEMYDDHAKNLAAFRLITTPGMTSQQLYQQGKKSEAFAKWLVDTNKIDIRMPRISDRYMAALNIVPVALSGSAPQIDSMYQVSGRVAEFESKVKSADSTLKVVTYEAKANYWVYAVTGFVGLGMVCGVVFRGWRKRKGKKL